MEGLATQQRLRSVSSLSGVVNTGDKSSPTVAGAVVVCVTIVEGATQSEAELLRGAGCRPGMPKVLVEAAALVGAPAQACKSELVGAALFGEGEKGDALSVCECVCVCGCVCVCVCGERV